MLFLSRFKNYQYGAVKAKYMQLSDGSRPMVENGYTVEFRRFRALEPWEEELARNTFTFLGQSVDGDNNMVPIDPVKQRVSIFDTEWVPEEWREQVEKRLLESSAHGTDFVLAEKPPLVPPWPKYGTLVADKAKNRDNAWVARQVVTYISDGGLDAEKVLEYERETENRPEVVEALEALLVPEGDVEVAA